MLALRIIATCAAFVALALLALDTLDQAVTSDGPEAVAAFWNDCAIHTLGFVSCLAIIWGL